MDSSPPSDARSQPVGPEDRDQVLEKLLGKRLSQRARLLRLENRGGRSLRDLWRRVDERGKLVACALLSCNPGKTASLALSSIHQPGQAIETVSLLKTVSSHALGSGQIDLIQYLANPQDALERSTLREAGFIELATLVTMERANSRVARPPIGKVDGELTSAAIDDDAMLALLRDTYEDSLDCPGLSKLRHERDILDGHRRGGNFEQHLWTILKINGANAGVSILNRTPEADCIEVAYFGLAKSARGKGFGAQLLDHSLFLAAKHSERSIMLAVDERNSPALRLYASRGFRVLNKRVALALSSLQFST